MEYLTKTAKRSSIRLVVFKDKCYANNHEMIEDLKHQIKFFIAAKERSIIEKPTKMSRQNRDWTEWATARSAAAVWMKSF